MTDARYQDGNDRPLHLAAQDTEDLSVIAALLQDAVLPVREMKFDPRRRRFLALLNRFRWEDRAAAEAERRGYERVRSLLTIADVRKVNVWALDRTDEALILSVLSMSFEPGEDGTGRLALALSGGAALALDVEVLDVTLRDVTRPYLAPSGRLPGHEV